ncbi:MAG: RDD family protein [Bacilli bacterium]|nr:RDD family protein [Bacilli bacterium]
MRIGLKKRLLAYVIDLLIIGLCFGPIVMSKEKDENLMKLRSELNIVNELRANKEYKASEHFERYTVITQQIDQECIIYKVLNIIFILGYFTILPYFWNGQTIGKRVMKIKVMSEEDEKVTIVNYLIRNLINGLGHVILILLFLYLLPNKMYFAVQLILSFIQIILVMTSIYMILYRKDKRGLHDVFSGTKVVSTLEVGGK